MGSNTIIAIVVGAILVIVGFALWPVLNGASNSLYSYFQDSCDDGNGNRFGKIYVGINNTTLGSRDLGSSEYNTDERVHGGSGTNIADAGGQCRATGIQGGDSTLALATSTSRVYNEQGDDLGGLNSTGSTTGAGVWLTTTADPHVFVKVAPMLDRFAGYQQPLVDGHPSRIHRRLPWDLGCEALQLRKRYQLHRKQH